MMSHPLFVKLAPYRARRRRRAVVTGLVLGLAAGVLVGGGLRLAGRKPAGLAAFLVLPVLGAGAGLLRRQRWGEVATAVDAAAGLDDHLASAVEFATLADRSPVHDLQLADAGRRLDAARPADVLPVRPPRGWAAVAVAYLLAGGLWLGGGGTPARADPPPAHVLEAARTLEQLADELTTGDGADEFKELAAELRQAAEALRQPGCDEATALKGISDVQDQVAAKQAAGEAAAAKTEAGLKTAGEGMQSAAPLKPAGQALKQGQLAKAARALAGVPGSKFDPKDARDGKEGMGQAADRLQADGLPELSAPCRQLADGAGGDLDQLKKGADELARQALEQDRRRRINLLTARLHRYLTECKKNLEERNLLEQKQKQGEGAAGPPTPLPAVPSEDDLRKKLDDPKFRAKVEALLKKFDPDGTGELDEGPSNDPADGPPDPAAPRRPGGRDRLRKFDTKLEEALQRERVPVIYYDAVRAYFRRMAELDTPPVVEGKR